MTSVFGENFGSCTVTSQERKARIRQVFRAVAPRYDLMNDLMSLGLHRLWKRALVRAAAPGREEVIVDLAGGTGDIAAGLATEDRRVLVCDPSTDMMQVGRRRELSHVGWLAAEAESLPFRTGSLDCVIIAFGLRNVTQLDGTLVEMLRVLRPGGRFLCLEFSRPQFWLRPLYELYSRFVIPQLATWVTRKPEAYLYLIESIRRFADQEQLKRYFEEAGFCGVRYRNFSFGIVCLHEGTRPAKVDS